MAHTTVYCHKLSDTEFVCSNGRNLQVEVMHREPIGGNAHWLVTPLWCSDKEARHLANYEDAMRLAQTLIEGASK